MWTIVVLSLHLMSGQANVITPQTGVVAEAGTFENEAACNAALAASVPSKLDKVSESEWRDGYRRFVCVRIKSLAVK